MKIPGGFNGGFTPLTGFPSTLTGSSAGSLPGSAGGFHEALSSSATMSSFRQPFFARMPSGSPAGASGGASHAPGVATPSSSAHAPKNISEALRENMRAMESARDLLNEQLKAVSETAGLLEQELTSAQQERNELLQKVQSLESTLVSPETHQALLEELETARQTAEESTAALHKVQEELADVKKQAAQHASVVERAAHVEQCANDLAKRLAKLSAEIKSLHGRLQHVSNSVQTFVPYFDAVGESIEASMAWMEDVLAQFEGFFGTTSPVAEALNLRAGLSLLQGARQMFAKAKEHLPASEGAPVPLPSPSEGVDEPSPQANPGIEQLGKKRIMHIPLDITALPGLDETVASALAVLGNETLMGICSRFPEMYADYSNKEEIYPRIKAFLNALLVLNEHKHIRGAHQLLRKVIAILVHPGTHPLKARGFVHEFIRIAQMIQSGRQIDVLGLEFSEVEIQGWWFDQDRQAFRKGLMRTEAEVDALSGKTFLEIKSKQLGGQVGDFIQALLESGSEQLITPYDASDRKGIESNGTDPRYAATQFVNQLLRYRKFIDEGKAEGFELHVTSRRPVADNVISAIYSIFDEGTFQLIWYKTVLETEGTLLVPNSPTGSKSAEEKSPSSAPASTTDPISEIPTKQSTDTPETPDSPPPTTPSPADVEKQDATAESRKATSSQAAPAAEDASSAPPKPADPAPVQKGKKAAHSADDERNLITQDVYEVKAGLMHMVDHNYDILEEFINWLQDRLHWKENLFNLPQEERWKAMRGLLETFQEEAALQPTSTSPSSKPWKKEKVKRAQQRFNALLKKSRNKEELDWTQPHTQGVQNNDIIEVIKSLQAQRNVEKNSELKEHIRVFISELKRLPGSKYFKTQEDGPALIDVMQHYLWATQRKAS